MSKTDLYFKCLRVNYVMQIELNLINNINPGILISKSPELIELPIYNTHSYKETAHILKNTQFISIALFQAPGKDKKTTNG